jgi:hypothetical protein
LLPGVAQRNIAGHGLFSGVLGWSLQQHISVAPDWPTGIALGVGGLAGGYTGARLQSRMPDVLIRRLVGVLVIGIGAYFFPVIRPGLMAQQDGATVGGRDLGNRGQPMPGVRTVGLTAPEAVGCPPHCLRGPWSA